MARTSHIARVTPAYQASFEEGVSLEVIGGSHQVGSAVTRETFGRATVARSETGHN